VAQLPSADDDGSPDTSPDEPGRLHNMITFGRDQIGAGRSWGLALFERHRHRPLVDLGLRIYERDREAAGSVVGSAIAFRLFLFFVPLLLFVVGVLGFFAEFVSSNDVDDAGITGTIADQINTALAQPNSTRWIAVVLGLFGMLSTGRTLSKALSQASCLAWRLPMRTKASVRVIAGTIGLLAGIAVVTSIVNRIRQEAGVAVAGASFAVVLVIYVVGALLLQSLLPRPTSDPGVLLPGAALVGLTITGLQAISQLYLPDRFSRASQLYGAIGATVVTLGWFFFAGRAMVLANALNAAVYERFGSITAFVFGLPVLRALPRRWAWMRRHFDLPEPESPPTAGPGA
jgi:uncharacterized BrkB/YihY/UPF0761 family membrane protein